jgi:hypothetical protein
LDVGGVFEHGGAEDAEGAVDEVCVVCCRISGEFARGGGGGFDVGALFDDAVALFKTLEHFPGNREPETFGNGFGKSFGDILVCMLLEQFEDFLLRWFRQFVEETAWAALWFVR